MISADMKHVKIIDFGMSREGVDKLGSTTQNNVVAYRWCAPEAFDLEETGVTYSFESDVWAFACTILELLDLTVPFDNVRTSAIPALIREGKTPRINPKWKAPIPELVEKCFSFQPKERPTAEEIYTEFKNLVECNALFGKIGH